MRRRHRTIARWKMVHQGFKGLFLVGMIGLLASCESSPGGNECGGIGGTVSCGDIVSITPESQNVDAFQNICTVDDQGNILTVEEFTDHNADITFANNTFPGAQDSFDIRLLSYTVSFTLARCSPLSAGCPPISSFTKEETILIRPGEAVTDSFPLVPIDIKIEYDNDGGDPFTAAEYTAEYVFTGQTTRFEDTITIEGSTTFTISDFDNCP